MSWVLTIRTIALVTLVASVWARIMASPSRISTSEGGITTPKVLATQTNAVLSAAGTPRASSLGATLREGLGPYALRHHACHTCYQYGALCANPSGARRDA